MKIYEFLKVTSLLLSCEMPKEFLVHDIYIYVLNFLL